MKYYFGQIPAGDADMFGDELFVDAGDAYYGMVEFGTNPGGIDDFVISDTAGRSIPLSIDHIDTIIQVLEDIKNTLDQVQTGKDALVAIYNPDEIRTFEW